MHDNQIDEVVAKLALRDYHYLGGNLLESNKQVFLLFVRFWLALAADLDDAFFFSVKRALLSEGISDVGMLFTDLKALTDLLHRLYNDMERPELAYPAFKQQGRTLVIHKWLVTTTIHLQRQIVEDEFFLINQWLSFGSRITFPELDVSHQIDEYREMETRLALRSYPDLTRESTVVSNWLADYHPFLTNSFPQHGPGATAECQRKWPATVKNRNFYYDDDLDQFLSRYLLQSADEFLFEPKLAKSQFWRTCSLVFVPKSPLKYRTISKEPTTLQFCQQAIKNGLVDYLSTCPDFSRHVDFTDQEASRRLALKGSKDGSFDTIDLSNASDDVTFALAHRVFKDTKLVDALVATRSRFVEIEGLPLALAKFAPMGSALCFPVETIIFASICESCAELQPDTDSYYRVFGDDIITSSNLTDMVLQRLVELGFTPNRSKSFSRGGPTKFREACGIEAFNGIDVTPLRISRNVKPVDGVSANTIIPLVALANNAFERSYWHLRNQVLHLLKNVRYRGEPILYQLHFVKPPANYRAAELAARWPTETNFRTQSRYNHKLQRREHRCLTPLPDDNNVEDAESKYYSELRRLWRRQLTQDFDDYVRTYRGAPLSGVSDMPESRGVLDGKPIGYRWRLKWIED